MNQAIKQQWTTALRSGEYDQTYGALRVEDSYCVLGVLCDLHSTATQTPWNYNQRGIFDYSYLYHTSDLPAAVFDWAEIRRPVGELSRMNDNEMIFEALADYIDENF